VRLPLKIDQKEVQALEQTLELTNGHRGGA
jgi:hypothetical protein